MALDDRLDELFSRAGYDTPTSYRDVADDLWNRAMEPTPTRVRPLAQPVSVAPVETSPQSSPAAGGDDSARQPAFSGQGKLVDDQPEAPTETGRPMFAGKGKPVEAEPPAPVNNTPEKFTPLAP